MDHKGAIGSCRATFREVSSIMKEIGVIAVGTHFTATFITVVLGWGNPFANRGDPTAIRGFTLLITTCGSLIGTLTTCPLIVLLVRKTNARSGEPGGPTSYRTSTVTRNAWVVMRLSPGTLLLSVLVPASAISLLLWGGVSVVRYNLHSLFICITVNMCAVSMASNYRRFCRRQAVPNSFAPRRVKSVLPGAVLTAQADQPRRVWSRCSWKRSARRALKISIPSVATAMVAIQYITISRRIPFDSVYQFFIFVAVSSLLKTILPVVVKFYVAQSSVHDLRNAFFMVSAPMFHIDIQLSMAMLKAQTTMPLVITSGFVNAVELVSRAASVAFDLTLAQRAERQFAKMKIQLQDHNRSSEKNDLKTRLELLEETHNIWKKKHFRVCAAETIASMAAEYCSIGLATIYMLVLQGNESVDLPEQTGNASIGFFSYEAQAWATQMAFEIVTDVIAMLIEVRLGIPVAEVIKNDADSFIRWSTVIIAAHACGLCVSSFVVAD